MIKTSVAAVVQAYACLEALSSEKMDSAFAFRVSRMRRKMQDDVKLFHDARNALIQELGVKKDDSDEYQVGAQNVAEFTRRVSELGQVEIDIDTTPLDAAGFGDVKLTPGHFDALGMFCTLAE